MKITVDVRDGLNTAVALARLATWYAEHDNDPEKTPMTGVVIHRNGMVLFKRDYRKGDCFVVYYDATRDKRGVELPTLEVERPTKEVGTE